MGWGFYAAWPSFACMAIVLGLAATPAMTLADSPPGGRRNRLAAMDGLRGFLALAVVFHHAAMYHRFLIDGRWEPTPSRFYDAMGPVGVSLFFMITGYLFWSRLVDAAGRPAWAALYIGRVFRIGPLYLAAVGVMLAVVFLQTGTASQPGGAAALLRQVGPWLALGALSGGDVDAYHGTSLLLAGVTWTLQSEWTFYLGLPVLALAARSRRAALPIVAVALAICLTRLAVHPASAGRVAQAALFLTGMMCASLHRQGLVARIPDAWASVLVVALLAAGLLCAPAYTPGMVVLLGLTFYLVTSGCTVFGLLTSRPAIRLGDVSYGIYLLQGLVLAAVLRPAPLRAFALASPAGHWSLVLLACVSLVAVATVAHVGIEQPGIALGRRAAAALGRVASRPARIALAGQPAAQP